METWTSVNNRLDALNLDQIIIEDYDDGFPIIEIQDHNIEGLTAFHYKPNDNYAHFFLDDYQFERVWNKPKKYLNKLKQFGGVLSPDFSLYTDYPIPVQIWNTYRNRWLGHYWQQHGIKVIPTIGWSTPESYQFCFKGIPKHSIVAISSIGVMDNKQATELFYQGYNKLKQEIQPKEIILYGYKCPDNIDVTFIQNRRFNNGR